MALVLIVTARTNHPSSVYDNVHLHLLMFSRSMDPTARELEFSCYRPQVTCGTQQQCKCYTAGHPRPQPMLPPPMTVRDCSDCCQGNKDAECAVSQVASRIPLPD